MARINIHVSRYLFTLNYSLLISRPHFKLNSQDR